MKLYHYIPWDYGIKALESRKLKVSLLHSVNDPNEFNNFYIEESMEIDTIRRIKKLFEKSAGLICLSSKWNNPLMWGHYSDNHKGLCFQFEIDDNIVNQVQYSAKKKINPLSKTTPEFIESFLMESLHTKSLDWKYEQEYRIITELKKCEWNKDSDMYFINFSDQIKLTGILLGLRSPKQEIYIKNILKNCNFPNEVNIARVKVSNKTFDFKSCNFYKEIYKASELSNNINSIEPYSFSKGEVGSLIKLPHEYMTALIKDLEEREERMAEEAALYAKELSEENNNP